MNPDSFLLFLETIARQYPLLMALISLVVVLVLLNLFSMLKIYRTHQQLDGKLLTYSDLDILKETINLNMGMAIVVIALNILMVLLLVYGYFYQGISSNMLILFFIAYSVLTFPLGIIGKKFENLLRTLRVETHDQIIADTYERYLKEWQEARFRLSD
ncbi:hypothetical protein JXQ70_20790 [bacterium]|nr:hypothetical protein [bacterium]